MGRVLQMPCAVSPSSSCVSCFADFEITSAQISTEHGVVKDRLAIKPVSLRKRPVLSAARVSGLHTCCRKAARQLRAPCACTIGSGKLCWGMQAAAVRRQHGAPPCRRRRDAGEPQGNSSVVVFIGGIVQFISQGRREHA